VADHRDRGVVGMVAGDGPQRLFVAVPESVPGLTARERDVEVTTGPSLGAVDVGVDRLGIAPRLEVAGAISLRPSCARGVRPVEAARGSAVRCVRTRPET